MRGGKTAAGLAIRRIDARTEFAERSAGFSCENNHLAAELFPPAPVSAESIAKLKAVQASYTARIAIETDYEYYQLFGNATDAADYAGDLVGYSSVIYDAEVDMTAP